MKKIFLLLVTLVLLISCGNKDYRCESNVGIDLIKDIYKDILVNSPAIQEMDISNEFIDDFLKNKLKFELIRTNKLEENIKKCDCTAKLKFDLEKEFSENIGDIDVDYTLQKNANNEIIGQAGQLDDLESVLLSYYLYLQLKEISSQDLQVSNVSGNKVTSEDEAIQIEDINYDTYCNSRFGFCVDYPVGILFPQGESSSEDGQVFKSKDAENTLWAYRDYRDNINSDSYSIKNAYEEDLADFNKVFTYKKLGKSFYVLSGYNNGKIFYQKTIKKNDQLVTCLIEYRESDKDIYNKISERIFKSFK